MNTPTELSFFLQHGYLHVPAVFTEDKLTHLQTEFDRVWAMPGHNNQTKLLQHQAFIDLVESPGILDRQRALFGSQTQLLQYDLLRQGPRNESFPMRAWHRDFVFPGDTPLSVNTIVYLNEMTEERGPTYVVPGSHIGPLLPPNDKTNEPLQDEVSVLAKAGDVVFINSAIWHSGSRNRSDGERRGIYMYYGHWWLKRYELGTDLPWQSLCGASERRLELLGVKMPAPDLHQYTPDAGRE